MSVVSKIKGSIVIKDETYGKPFHIKLKDFPFWATRKRN